MNDWSSHIELKQNSPNLAPQVTKNEIFEEKVQSDQAFNWRPQGDSNAKTSTFTKVSKRTKGNKRA